VGVFAALRGAELGARTVLIDARGIFGGSSSRSAGCFTVQLDTPLDARLVLQSIELVTRYSRRGWMRTGFLQIGRESDLEDTIRSLRSEGISYETLSPEEISERWHWFRIDHGLFGLFTEPDLSSEPLILGEELRARLVEGGVELREGDRVVSIESNGHEVKGVRLANSETVHGVGYVVATGAWTGELLKTLGLSLDSFLITYYAYSIDIGQELKIPSFSNEALHTYWRPWGRQLIGGRYDGAVAAEPDLSDTPPPTRSMKAALKLISRVLTIDTEPRITQYLKGPCSFSPDGLPIFGFLPGHNDTIVTEGLGGYGLMRGPALGKRAADMLLLHKTDEDMLQFSPERLLNSKLK